MKVILDTVNEDLFMALFDENNNLVDKWYKENIKYKVEFIPDIFREFLTKSKLSIQDINKYYVNIGPGSFTGSRIGLVFFRTLVQLNSKSQLSIINNFSWIAGPFFSGKIYIDAKGKKYYCGTVKDGILEGNPCIELINESVLLKKIDYDFIIENISQYFQLFEKVDNLLEIKPIYLNDPQIGD